MSGSERTGASPDDAHQGRASAETPSSSLHSGSADDTQARRGRSTSTPQGAGRAAAYTFGVNLLLGVLGLASASFVISRLFESWRVAPGSHAHTISLLGQRLSYPVANTGAVIVTGLAALGLLMAASAGRSLARELRADRRFRRALASRTALPARGTWSVIFDDEPQAFCAGLLHPRIYISTGALELLDEQALAAVVAHERHHVMRHDPLRLACGRALLAGLFFIPSLRRMLEHQQVLAEIGADEAAVSSNGVERAALASAMLSFSDAAGDQATGVDPRRVDHLLGDARPVRFPLVLCLSSAIVLLLLSATALLAAHVANGTATLAPPILSAQPCVAVLAMVPVVAGVAAMQCARVWRTRRDLASTEA